jgi:hypothetical protein
VAKRMGRLPLGLSDISLYSHSQSLRSGSLLVSVQDELAGASAAVPGRQALDASVRLAKLRERLHLLHRKVAEVELRVGAMRGHLAKHPPRSPVGAGRSGGTATGDRSPSGGGSGGGTRGCPAASHSAPG